MIQIAVRLWLGSTAVMLRFRSGRHNSARGGNNSTGPGRLRRHQIHLPPALPWPPYQQNCAIFQMPHRDSQGKMNKQQHIESVTERGGDPSLDKSHRSKSAECDRNAASTPGAPPFDFLLAAFLLAVDHLRRRDAVGPA